MNPYLRRIDIPHLANRSPNPAWLDEHGFMSCVPADQPAEGDMWIGHRILNQAEVQNPIYKNAPPLVFKIRRGKIEQEMRWMHNGYVLTAMATIRPNHIVVYALDKHGESIRSPCALMGRYCLYYAKGQHRWGELGNYPRYRYFDYQLRDPDQWIPVYRTDIEQTIHVILDQILQGVSVDDHYKKTVRAFFQNYFCSQEFLGDGSVVFDTMKASWADVLIYRMVVNCCAEYNRRAVPQHAMGVLFKLSKLLVTVTRNPKEVLKNLQSEEQDPHGYTLRSVYEKFFLSTTLDYDYDNPVN